MMRSLACLITIALAGCAGVPRDPDGTSAAIAARGTIRVGIASDEGPVLAGSRTFLATLARQTGARPVIVEDPTEPLLTRLEEGHLDLVLAPLAHDSPWVARVSFGPVLAEERIGKTRHLLRPILRNGENGWIARVHHAAVAAGGTIE